MLVEIWVLGQNARWVCMIMACTSFVSEGLYVTAVPYIWHTALVAML